VQRNCFLFSYAIAIYDEFFDANDIINSKKLVMDYLAYLNKSVKKHVV